jgi:hypothetical protein
MDGDDGYKKEESTVSVCVHSVNDLIAIKSLFILRALKV